MAALALLAGLWFLLGAGGDPMASNQEVSAAERTPEGGLDLDLGDAQLAAPVDADGVRAAGALGATRVRLGGPGRLVGRVLERASGGGLAGVEVRLLPVPPAGSDVVGEAARFFGLGDGFAARVEPVATTSSDATGGFAFRGVREGTWFVDARAPHPVADHPVSARVLASGDGGPVDVWMRGGGRIVGRVVDTHGVALPGADVVMASGAARFLEAASTGEIAFLRTRTDGDGRFAFSAVAPAEGYEVAAIGEGIAPTYVIGVDVRAGEDTEVLIEGRASAVIRGRIVGRWPGGGGPSEDGGDSAGAQPIEGALVGAMPRGLRYLGMARDIIVATHGVTDANGEYELHGVPPGAVDLLAIAPGHVPARGPLVHAPASGTVGATDFVLRKGPMVRGQVIDERGMPVAGAKVLWNVIDFRSVEGQPSMAPLFIAGMKDFAFPETDADGRFVAGPFPGNAPFRLRVVADGYGLARTRWRPSPGGARIDGVASPEALDEIQVVLSRGGGVMGRVLEADTGDPVTTFTVRVSQRIESNGAAPSRWNPFAGGIEVEDDEGRFFIEAVEAGEQRVSIEAPGFIGGSTKVMVPEGGEPVETVVALRVGARVRGVVLDSESEPVAGAQVTTEGLLRSFFGRVDANGRAMEDDLAIRGPRRPRGRRMPPVGFLRYMAALGLMGTQVVTSAPDGSFELTGLEPGQDEVLAFHRDYRVGAVPVSLVDGETAGPVEVVLTEGGGLTGTVRDRFGRPVVEATVLALSPGMAGASPMGGGSNGAIHQARSGTDGVYLMRHMEPGPYFLLATRGDENLAITSFLGSLNFSLASVPEDRIATHDLVDTSAAGCRVHGRVLRGGDPVGGGILLALNLDAEGLLGIDFKAAPVEQDGTYSFAGLAPGEYQITYEGPGPNGALILDVPDAPELAEDIALPEGRVSGRLVDAATGAAIGGARVVLTPTDRLEGPGILAQLIAGESGVERARSRDDGTFSFRGLAEGTYRVTVEDARVGGGEDRVDYAPMRPVDLTLGEDEAQDLGDLRLDPGVTVRGLVLDEGGQPIAGADVFASLPMGRRSRPRRATTGDDGSFHLRGLGTGEWQLTVEAEGFAPSEPQDLPIEDGESGALPELRLRLVRGQLMRVRVTDAGGVPVAGATCVLRRTGARAVAGMGNPGDFFQRFFSGGSTTDEGGEMDLGRHGPGSYELRASQGMRSKTLEVELEVGGPDLLDISF